MVSELIMVNFMKTQKRHIDFWFIFEYSFLQLHTMSIHTHSKYNNVNLPVNYKLHVSNIYVELKL